MDNYDNKTLEQLFQHCLNKRKERNMHPLSPSEHSVGRMFFLAGIIMAKGMAQDSHAFSLNQFADELREKIEGQLAADLV